jgi:hypothetical protein
MHKLESIRSAPGICLYLYADSGEPDKMSAADAVDDMLPAALFFFIKYLCIRRAVDAS